MKNQPNIAIIIPVYNSEHYLSECLDSLVQQSYRNFTAFCVDDGSTDRSSSILDEYASRDSRIKVFHKKNGGVSSARNFALDEIKRSGKFEFITFLDSDDKYQSQCLTKIVEHITSKHLDYLVFGYCEFDKTKNYKDQWFYPKKKNLANPEAILNHYILDPNSARGRDGSSARFLLNKVFRSSIISHVRFNEKLSFGEDQDFFLSALPNLNNGQLISDCLLEYRLRKSSLSHSQKYKALVDAEIFLSFLRKNKSWISQAGQIKIQKLILKKWWHAIQLIYCRIGGDKHAEAVAFASKIKRLHFALDLKSRKRFFLFSLGPTFLYIYFHKERQKASLTKQAMLDKYFE